ncbi:MAG: hypothetical protein ABH884_04320 [Candidatus Komeilibacteria bacterium]
MKISEQVLKLINKKKLTPHSKWRFLVVDISWWLLFVTLFIIGSLSFGVILFLLTEFEWLVAKEVAGSWWEYLILFLPIFWLILIITAIVLASLEFRQTKHGYRHNMLFITTVIVLGSMVLGSLVFFSGYGEKTDNLFTNNLSFYRGKFHQQMNLWDRADQGLLMGRIIEVKPEELSLVNPQRINWLVNISRIDPQIKMMLMEDQLIKARGVRQGNNHFIADYIIPLPMEEFEEMMLEPGMLRGPLRFFEINPD